MKRAAQAARDEARDAQLVAAGLRDALDTPDYDSNAGNLLPLHAQARYARDRAQDQLQEAIRAVLLAELAPTLQRAYDAQAALAAELPAILGLFQVLRMSPRVYPFAGNSSEVHAHLKQLLGQLPAHRELESFLGGGIGGSPEIAQSWTAFGRALATDADAALQLP